MDVVIIGGSAAGLKAACRIARLQPDARVKVLVKGEHFGYSGCGLPYFLSGDVPSYGNLISTSDGMIKDELYFKEVKGIEVLNHHEALRIDRSARLVFCKDKQHEIEVSFPYDKLVIATGTNPITPSIPGINVHGVCYFSKPSDALALHEDLTRGKIETVTIFGGGFIGLELCEAFKSLWDVNVNLIELQSRVAAGLLDEEMSMMIEDELLRHEISLHLTFSCREIVQVDDSVIVKGSDGNEIRADRVIIAAGVLHK